MAKGMHPEDIKAAIRKKGKTLESLSIKWGFEASAVASAISRPWVTVQELIASFLGKSPQEIWPDRYNADGTPKPTKQSKEQNTASSAQINSQIRPAA